VAWALEMAGIIVNYNTIPGDTSPAFYPSGIRLGTVILTTRGMKEKEMIKIGEWINEVVDYVKKEKLPEGKEKRKLFVKDFKQRIKKDKWLKVKRKQVAKLAKKFPVMGV